MEKNLIFISGGARSGKTSFAENYALEIAKIQKAPLYYIATSKKEDKEMIDRIQRHQDDRQQSQANWQTIEQARDIAEIKNNFSAQAVALLDCVTLLATNELFYGDFNVDKFANRDYQKEIKEKIVDGISQISKKVATLIVVSNEVLYESFDPDNQLVWFYQKLLGDIHQELVRMADEAYLIEAGLPIKKK